MRKILVPLLLLNLVLVATPGQADQPAAATPPQPDRGAEIIAASQRGDIPAVRALLAAGVAVDSKSTYGATPLFFAADKGNRELAALLLEAGASVEVVDTFYQATPLQWVLFKARDSEPHRAVLRLMLPRAAKGGDSVDAALALGVQSGDLELVGLALAAEATPKARRSALAAARTAGAEAVVAVLEPATPALEGEAFALAAEARPAYLGEYASAEAGFGLQIVEGAGDGSFQMTVPGQEPMVLEPVSAELFEVRGVPGLALRFAPTDGTISSVTVVQGERETVLPRRVAAAATADAAMESPAPAQAAVGPPPVVARGAARPWPELRGTNRSGAGDAQGAPRSWNAERGENIAWKTPIPGLGLSSPVVWGSRVFLTTAVSESGGGLRTGLYGDVDSVEDSSAHTWMLLALDLKTGAIVWQREVARGAPKVKRHLKSSHANPTAATDGRVVVASFGSEGLLAFSVEGEQLWKVDLGVLSAGWFFDPTYEWEFASSPIIHDGKVLLQADVHGGAFVIALDLATGRELWRTRRDEIPTWSTPAVLANPGDGPDELVTNGSRAVRGYDLATGAELWTLAPNSEIVVASPVVADGLAYVVGGYPPVQPIYALRPGGRGDLSLASGATSNATVVWSLPRGGSYIPTPIVYAGVLHVLHNNGRLAAYDAASGEELYRERVGRGEGFSASPVAADGVLFLTAESGTTYVVRAGRQFELLGTNELDEAVLATPAISDGHLLIRGERHLFALATPTTAQPEPATP